MRLFAPEDLQTWTGGNWVNLSGELRIIGFSNDTRTLEVGDMFLALKTESRDGHDFLQAAEEAGASAALVERAVPESKLPQLVVPRVMSAFKKIGYKHRKRFPGVVIGITGSCGKTSSKELLLAMLGADITLATRENENNQLGVPLTLTRLDPSKHRYAIIEAGTNQLGELPASAALIEPDVAVTTMITGAHLEGLGGSVESVAKEKSALSDALGRGGFCVFPEHCLDYGPFKAFKEHAYVLVEKDKGLHNPPHACEYSIEQVSAGRVEIRLQYPEASPCTFAVRPLTRGMLDNVALTAWVALLLGRRPEAIQAALDAWKPVALRGQTFQKGPQTFYVDCYSAIPAALYDALDFFKKRFADEPNHLYVLGEMRELGSIAKSVHYELGLRLKLRPQDRVLVVGEVAEPLVRGLIKGGNPPDCITFVHATEEARPFVEAFKGVIFLKGKHTLHLWELVPEGAEELKETPKTEALCSAI